jgi:hypothetical protein
MKRSNEKGILLLPVMVMLGGVMLALGTLHLLSLNQTANSGAYRRTESAFFAAEGGLALRAENIRTIFGNNERPTGTGPTEDGTECQGSNVGSDDFACIDDTTSFSPHRVISYLNQESAASGITIPPGELYAGLSATEWAYRAVSRVLDGQDRSQASLENIFRFRVVPLFQFGAFFDKDLEFIPGPPMDMNGPVHANGDIYVDSQTQLNFHGSISALGDLYYGLKFRPNRYVGSVGVVDPTAIKNLPSGGSQNRVKLTPTMLTQWNNNIRVNVEKVALPPLSTFAPSAGNTYWDKADARLVLIVDHGGNPSRVEWQNVDGSKNNPRSDTITNSVDCSNAGRAGTSILPNERAVHWSPYTGSNETAFRDRREGGFITMLEVDMKMLLYCIKAVSNPNKSVLTGGRSLNDTSDGGIILYLTVKGPRSALDQSFYGVRVRNGKSLQDPDLTGSGVVKGVTIVSDQPLYIQGDYNNPVNTAHKVSASFIGDTINVLSNAHINDSSRNGFNAASSSSDSCDLSCRLGSNTTIQAAFLAGSDTTGWVEGVGGQDRGISTSNGGLNNLMRFHEDWTGSTFTYSGSLTSLRTPQRAKGAFRIAPIFAPPTRDWSFDSDFTTSGNLPPLSPAFSYFVQDQFMRDFNLE